MSGCALITIMYHFSHRVPGRLSRNAQFLAHHLCTSVGEAQFLERSGWAHRQVSSCRFTGFHWFDHVVGFVASSIVIPHLKIKPLQVHCVLLGVEQRTGYSLLPHFATYFFQAAKKLKPITNASQHFIYCLLLKRASADPELPVQKQQLPHQAHMAVSPPHHFRYGPALSLHTSCDIKLSHELYCTNLLYSSNLQ